MNQQRDLALYQGKSTQQFNMTASGAEALSDSLLARAVEVQSEQASLLSADLSNSQYSAALAGYVEEKHQQVERIEDKLEGLIEQQASRLQQKQAQQPGSIALPGTRQKWQKQLLQLESAMQQLHARLDAVREIKDGMGVHGPRLEELAVRKLRVQDPGLAKEWDELQEAARLSEAHQRTQREKEQRAQRHAGALGLSQALSIRAPK